MKPYIYSFTLTLLLVLLSWGTVANAQSKTSAGLTLAQASVNNPKLAEAINKAGLMPLLTGTGPYTFFAPSDAALKELSGKSAEATREILMGHIVEGSYTTADLHDGRTLTTIGKQTIKIFRKKDKVLLNGRRIINPNQPSRNGIMHTVDNLLVKELSNLSLL